MFDTSALTEAGYKGADVKNILMPLAKNHAADKGIGLVFLDEIDKKLQPSSDGRNFNAAAQSNLLTMLEGQKFDPDEEYNEKEMIDTSNTMFIGCGAFDYCRDDKKKAVLGFGTSKGGNHYDEITLEDIVSHGGMHQLVGRFTSIINYNALSSEAIDKIIDLLLKKASEDNNCQLHITEGMRAYLHKNANTEYGCRRLDSIIRDRAADLIITILMKKQPLPKTVLLDSPEKKEKVMEQE
jgi:ATP-dependent protease Clp ATPase subunit